MIQFAKIILHTTEASTNPTSEELAKVVMQRIGLEPRKKGATENMYRTLLELYERTKQAQRQKKQELAVMTVEEMGLYAGISRQTMYDYLGRWLNLDLITKASYIKDNNVVIGYRLNGPTLEVCFSKALDQIKNNMTLTLRYVQDLQKTIKNEKISAAQKNNQAVV